jgi:hypothetical protein
MNAKGVTHFTGSRKNQECEITLLNTYNIPQKATKVKQKVCKNYPKTGQKWGSKNRLVNHVDTRVPANV